MDVAIKSRVRCGIATALRKMEGCLYCRILIECQLEEAIYWRHFVPTEEIGGAGEVMGSILLFY